MKKIKKHGLPPCLKKNSLNSGCLAGERQAMKCRKAEKLITAYLLEDLDAGMTDVVKKHLESCPGCRKKADEIKKTLDLLQNAFSSGELSSTVLEGPRKDFLRNAMMNNGKPVVSAAPFLSVAAAVVVCAGLAFLVYFWKLQNISRSVTAELRAREVAVSYLSKHREERRQVESTTQPETPRVQVRAEEKIALEESELNDRSVELALPEPATLDLKRESFARPSSSPAPARLAAVSGVEEKLSEKPVTKRKRSERDEVLSRGSGEIHLRVGSPARSLREEEVVLADQLMASEPLGFAKAEKKPMDVKKDSFDVRAFLSAALPLAPVPAEKEPVLSVEMARVPGRGAVMLVVATPGTNTYDVMRLILAVDPAKMESIREMGSVAPRAPEYLDVKPPAYQGAPAGWVFELQFTGEDDAETGAVSLLAGAKQRVVAKVALPSDESCNDIDSASARLRLAYCIGRFGDAMRQSGAGKKAALEEILPSIEKLNNEYPDNIIIEEFSGLVKSALNGSQ